MCLMWLVLRCWLSGCGGGWGGWVGGRGRGGGRGVWWGWGGMSRLVERLRRVLEVMVGDPGARVSSVDVLDVVEYARLDGWGNRAVLSEPVATAVSVPAVFGEHVARAAEAVAISCEGRSMTYGELDEASNRLAHLLIGLGAGPGERVGLLLNRSAEAVVAMLGVLKTGAAYVPLDPGHPDARIGFVLGDAAPVAVVSTAQLGARLGADVVVVD